MHKRKFLVQVRSGRPIEGLTLKDPVRLLSMRRNVEKITMKS